MRWSITGNLGSRQTTPNGYGGGGSGAGGAGSGSGGGTGRDVSSPPQNDTDYKYGRFDASALHIAHALKQTEIQKAYNKAREKPIDFYLVSFSSLVYLKDISNGRKMLVVILQKFYI